MTRLFSKKRVHPEPPPYLDSYLDSYLDPKIAPWSAPRHYTTTIKEEAAAIKAAARAGKPPVRVVGTKGFLRSPGTAKIHRSSPNCFTTIGEHIRDVYHQIVENFRVNSQQFIAKLFCIKIDVD